MNEGLRKGTSKMAKNIRKPLIAPNRGHFEKISKTKDLWIQLF